MSQLGRGEALRVEAQALKSLARELAALEEMGLKELHEVYLEFFGEEGRSKNLVYLRKKIAFRMQERVEGGLSTRAQAIIRELEPNELPTRHANPKKEKQRPLISTAGPSVKTRDPRLPAVGTILVREVRDFAHEIEVLSEGFSYRGRSYRSLSAIAREITGTAWNGFLFFGLKAPKEIQEMNDGL